MTLRQFVFAIVAVCSVPCSMARAQTTCVQGGTCTANSIPVFASSGTNPTLVNSSLSVSNGTVTVIGNLQADMFEVDGQPFAYGFYQNYNAFLGFSGNITNTGYNNDALGAGALDQLTSGTGNAAIGSAALGLNTGGSENTAVGMDALIQNKTGNFNVALGFNSLLNNTTGSDNTAVGSYSGPQSGSLSNTTSLGVNAIASQSNSLILGGTSSSAVSVGIGTSSPYNDYGLTVTTGGQGGVINGGVVVNATGGNLYLGMTHGTHKFRVDTNGAVYADGGLYASGADFAESIAVRGKLSQYEPGDVLEIDPQADRHLALSSHPYATRVAGIYSTKPGVLASPHHIDDESSKGSEVPLAVVGIVPCKVTAENGAINRGDLLVTSSTPGYAMKGTDRRKLVGAVVGKALEPLPNAKSKGVIEVLITLQ